MKHFIIVLSLIHFTAYAQNSSQNIYDELHSPSEEIIDGQVINRFKPPMETLLVWNELLQEWESLEINNYEYDSLGRILRIVTSTSPEILIREKEYSYTTSGKILTETNRVFDIIAGQMIDDNRIINEYNANGDKTYATFQVLEAGIWNTLTTDSTEFTYNDDGFQLSIVWKSFIDSILAKTSTTINNYDTLNRLLSREVSVDLGGEDQTHNKVELIYSDDSEPIEYTEFDYDADLEVWNETIKYTDLAYQSFTSYDENVLSHFIIQEWLSDAWINKTLSETTFNGENSINIKSEYLNGFWILETKIIKNYDEQGLPTLILEEFRNEDNWQTEQAEEYVNEYSNDFSEIKKITLKVWDDEFQSNQNYIMRVFDYPVNIKEVKDAMSFSIYPNPAQESVMISIGRASVQSTIFMQIFDINGKVITHKQLQNNEEQVDLKNLKSGIYFINLSDNKGSIKTEKLIVR